MVRFRLEQSTQKKGWWVLTDTENLVVIKFKEHEFNETQDVTLIDDKAILEKGDAASSLAHIMQEMGEYMVQHHVGIAFNCQYGFEYSEDNESLFLCRYQRPKWMLEILDEGITKEELETSLKGAINFLNKKNTDM